jgi:hypothetical protein
MLGQNNAGPLQSIGFLIHAMRLHDEYAKYIPD